MTSLRNGFDFTVAVKDLFFDRTDIDRQIGRATRRAISRSLAFVRTAARSKLRRRIKTSKPGESPSVHATNPAATLKKILFFYDERTRSGVVGPVKLNGTARKAKVKTTVPATLEFGGFMTMQAGAYLPIKEEQDRDTLGRYTKKRLVRTEEPARFRVKPRPFMTPAFKQERDAGHILSPWANVVSG